MCDGVLVCDVPVGVYVGVRCVMGVMGSVWVRDVWYVEVRVWVWGACVCDVHDCV